MPEKVIENITLKKRAKKKKRFWLLLLILKRCKNVPVSFRLRLQSCDPGIGYHANHLYFH